jgi:TolB-like protein/tetratricopeptide (TPR) repeat protein
MTLASGTKLGPYEILAPIGAGGMGEVYRARDKKLDRDVAIKVLPESVAADADALARFEREAKAVAALSHPNILSIHDFGTQDDVTYAVMELLEGETLREKLQAPITQKQVVGYALQIAKGLSAAHQKGVVHRDLKPENVFVMKDGHVKILDFGLAKRVEAIAAGEETSAPTVSGRTEPGTVMGTLGYMSPEQVRGLPVDHRSDIFSFGAILYELLSGQRAFRRGTAADTMSAILNEEPPDLSESGRNISPALDHIVRHCLEKDRDSRFQSAKDIAFALSEASGPATSIGAPLAPPVRMGRRLIAAAVVVGLAAAGATLLRRSHKAAGEAGVLKRVAVLPFENMGSPDDDYFADGIADAVRGKLTSLPGVQVIARGSSTPYRKTTKTPKQIAQELEVGYLLTATVRWQKSGGDSRVQVSPELVEVSGSGAPTSKWQQPFDAALIDVFQVQSDIATKVAQSLGVALGAAEERRLSATPTKNLAAYDAFLKGEEAIDREGTLPANLRRSITFFDEAVALDPGFAQAWGGVSGAWSLLYSLGTPTPEAASRAREAAARVSALAPHSAEEYLASGRYAHQVDRDYSRAVEQFEQALRRAPGNWDALFGLAISERALGRWSDAVEHFRQAKRLDPRRASTNMLLGHTLMYLRRYSEAREVAGQGLRLAPSNLDLIHLKAMTFLAQGDLAGARAVLKATPPEVPPTALVAEMAYWRDTAWVLDEEQRALLLRLTPSAIDDDRGKWGNGLALAAALKGDVSSTHRYAEQARQAFEEQLRATPQDPERHAFLGVVLAYLGRKEEAIREGKRAVALAPVAKDAAEGPYYQHQLARVYILVGEPEKALDQLEPLLKIPCDLSPGWLRIDPNFDPLRGNPRFQKLLAGAN